MTQQLSNLDKTGHVLRVARVFTASSSPGQSDRFDKHLSNAKSLTLIPKVTADIHGSRELLEDCRNQGPAGLRNGSGEVLWV